MPNHFGSTLREYILYILYTLYSFSESEHHPKCDEERGSNKEKCLRSSLSLRDLFRRSWLDWSWSRGNWSWSIELIGDTLIVSIWSALCCCPNIDSMRNDWESEDTDEFTIFAISFLESISCTDISFDKANFCSLS